MKGRSCSRPNFSIIFEYVPSFVIGRCNKSHRHIYRPIAVF